MDLGWIYICLLWVLVVEFCWQDMNLTKKELEQVGRSRWEEKRSPLILQIYIMSKIYALSIMLINYKSWYYKVMGTIFFAMTYGFQINPQTCQVHVIVTVPEKWVMSSVTKDQRWGGRLCYVRCWGCNLFRGTIRKAVFDFFWGFGCFRDLWWKTSYRIWWRAMCYKVLY